MEDTCSCPKCQMENAYHNGVSFVCPDCDNEWSGNSNASFTGNFSNFKEQIKLKLPFFKLEHGKLYDCKVEHERGIENISIIPLACKKGANLQFIMTDARKLFKQNPNFVLEIIKMDYDYICNDGIRSSYPFDYEALTINCATQHDGTLVDYRNSIIFDFKKTDII